MRYLEGAQLEDAWTTNEDQILLDTDDENEEARLELEMIRSEGEVDARSEFLNKTPGLLQQ